EGSPARPGPRPAGDCTKGVAVSDEFDVVVLGGGSGGYATALRAAQLGRSVALVEKDKVGGTCLHRGCIPAKALLHAAEVADTARESQQFGIEVELRGVDLPAVNRHKDGVVTRMYKGLQGLIKAAKVTHVEGEGRLVARDTVAVGDRRLVGRAAVLASGSYPPTLPGLGIDGGRGVTGDHALNLEQLPTSAIVLGGGVVGAEFASTWRSFGVEVTIVEALPRLMPGEDEDVSRQIERAFRRRGIGFRVGKPFESVERTGGGVRVSIAGGQVLEADLL